MKVKRTGSFTQNLINVAECFSNRFLNGSLQSYPTQNNNLTNPPHPIP